jgi:hypothetical protein
VQSIFAPSNMQLAALTREVMRMYGAANARVHRVEIPTTDDGAPFRFANGRPHAVEVTITYTVTDACSKRCDRLGYHTAYCTRPGTWHATYGWSRGRFELWAD